MATIETLLTIDDYARLPDTGRPTELVRGKVVETDFTTPLHGFVCARIVLVVESFVRQHDLGRVTCNNAGVITERNPDTLRGPDVAFYSYQRLPKGPIPWGYLDAVPNAVFEVRSPGDRRGDLLQKVGEYLTAGVEVACIVDPQTQTVEIHRASGPASVLGMEDDLRLPEVLPGFSVPVARLFG